MASLSFSGCERGGGIALCIQFTLEPLQCFELIIPALLQYLGNQAIGGVYLVILLKRTLRFILYLLYLAL
jgi:hypothetical protein